ncbi:MAG: hypothetical protein WB542_09675, partial [Polaromonas sp.]
ANMIGACGAYAVVSFGCSSNYLESSAIVQVGCRFVGVEWMRQLSHLDSSKDALELSTRTSAGKLHRKPIPSVRSDA